MVADNMVLAAGLTHLAVPCYERVLEISRAETTARRGEDAIVEDYAVEAAYNLQHLYFSAGNIDMAQRITQEWLVL